MIWTSIQAKEATQGEIFSDWKGGKIVFDSRLVEEGDIFIALPGAKVDGHEFVEFAFQKGAAAAIVSELPHDETLKAKILLVNNTLKALEDLANFKRKTTKAKIIAVTGSVGKTSLKEQLGLSFSAIGKTFSSRGNYNNFLGVPINLASMPDDCEFAIFEIGMDHAGEITPLTKMVKPDLAVITAIENIHRANFDSIEAIALAKAEIFHGLKENGVAILNSLSNCYELLHNSLHSSKPNVKIISLGKELEIEDYLIKENKTFAKLNILGKKLELTFDYILPLHQVNNMAIVLACISSFDQDLNIATKSLQNFTLQRGRGMVSKLKLANKNITLIDDSYNAGPVSVKAALKTMSNYSGRKIAILGDMVDLGPESPEMHKDLKIDIIKNNIDKVICFGSQMKGLYECLPEEKKLASVLTLKELAKVLPNFISEGDILLIKGSFYLTNLYGFTKHIYENSLDKI